ncbi:MAG: NAD-dependent epimerase/dehydratase family protein [Phycisphaerae bacterium]
MHVSNRNILVTGGAGFIGSHLVERLARRNFVRVLDNFSTGSWSNLTEVVDRDNVDVVEGDIRDQPALHRCCRGIDVVFHLAVSCLRTSLTDPQESHSVNAGGTLNVCEAAQAGGVERLVYVSSSEVYGTARQVPMSETHPLHPTTVYGAAKLAGEHYAKALQHTCGLAVVIVRPFNTYGPREPWRGTRAEVIPRFILQLRGGRPPVIFGDGSQTRDFIYVDDTVTGILRAAACDALVGQAVNIAAGSEVSIVHLAAMIAERLDRDIQPLFREPRPGDVIRHHADVTKARDLLGFVANTNIQTGLARCIAWISQAVPDEALVTEHAGAANW